MKSKLAFLTLLITMAGLVKAVCASPLKIENVSYKSGDETVTGYLAQPESGGPHPAIVVIHEWWGLNDWIKEQAQKFADQGYVALAVDLYRGKSTSDPSEAHELSRGLPQDRAIRDLKAAFAYLASRPDVNKDKIGSVGWCMGGGLSLQLAVHEPRLAACVVNYGSLPTDSAEIGKIHAPVLGNFGAEDRGHPARRCARFRKGHEGRQQDHRREGLRWCRTRLRKPQQQGRLSSGSGNGCLGAHAGVLRQGVTVT